MESTTIKQSEHHRRNPCLENYPYHSYICNPTCVKENQNRSRLEKASIVLYLKLHNNTFATTDMNFILCFIIVSYCTVECIE